MANKYLDNNGLLYFWQQIKSIFAKVEDVPTKTSELVNDSGFITTGDIPEGAAASTTTPKMNGTATVGTELAFARGDHVHPSDTSRVPTTRTVNGHALSANVTVTASDIGVASGAEVNQNAFSNVKVGTTTIAADSKTDTLELAAGLNITLTPDASGDKVTIAATDTTYSDATTSAHGLMTAEDKAKLNGIATGAEVNVQADWNESSTSSDAYIQNKPTIPSAGTGSSYPAMDGTRALGSNSGYARVDHVHPTDTSRAPLASPGLTGTPTAPTASAGTNTTQIATTAYVTTAIQNAQVGAATFKGTVNAPSAISGLTNYKKGWYWVVGTAGTYAGQVCEAGDMIFCVSDYGSAYSASDFDVIQTNLDITAITNSEIDTILAA